MHDGIDDEPALRLDDVTVRYGRTVAVERASLVVDQGELIALVGPNGAGKSTLFRAALGLVPYQGTIVVHQTRRRGVAFVPQRLDVDLDFPIAAGQVVATGRRALTARRILPSPSDRAAIARCMARVGLAGMEKRPLGALSGGEVQRVLVARALAQEPSVMLLDEPLSGVDAAATASLVELFARLADDGAAIVVSTHDLALVRERFSRCIAINRTIVGDGDPADILGPAGLERFFGLPASPAG
jgi:ABC-type Mn2+/Zn2+ transport system ATPase subunit